MTMSAVMRRMKIDAVPHGFSLNLSRLGGGEKPTTLVNWQNRRLHIRWKAKSKLLIAEATVWKSGDHDARVG